MLALLEVMDKENSFATLLLWAIGSVVLTFASARTKPWTLLLTLPVSLIFFFGQLTEVTDQFVGPAIRTEAGLAYVVFSWVSPLLILGAMALGLYLRLTHRSTRTLPL